MSFSSVYRSVMASGFPVKEVAQVVFVSGVATYLFKDINTTTYYKVHVPLALRDSTKEHELEVVTVPLVHGIASVFREELFLGKYFDTERALKVQGPLTKEKLEPLLHEPTSDLYNAAAIGLTGLKTGLVVGLLANPYLLVGAGVASVIHAFQHANFLPDQNRIQRETRVILINAEMPESFSSYDYNVVLSEFRRKYQ